MKKIFKNWFNRDRDVSGGNKKGKIITQTNADVSGGNKKGKIITQTNAAPDGYFLPQLSCDLLEIPYRKMYLQQLWENVSLPKTQYEELFLSPLKNCAERMQNLPAFSEGNFSQSGGLLDLTLLTMVYSIRLAKKRMLPVGGLPEDQVSQSTAWNSVVFYSSMLHWVPLMGQFEGEYIDQRCWMPGVTIPDSPYRFRFKSDELAIEDLRCVLGALMSYTLLPENAICWLSETPAALQALVHCIVGRQNDISVLINEAIIKLPEIVSTVISTEENIPKSTEKNGPNINTDIKKEYVEPIILEPIENSFSSAIPTLESSQQEILTGSVEIIDSDQQQIDDSQQTDSEQQIDSDIQAAMSLLGIETEVAHQDEDVEHCSLNDIPDLQSEDKVTHSESKLVDNSLYENKVVEIVKKNVFLKDAEETNTNVSVSVNTQNSDDEPLKTQFWRWLKKGLKSNEIKFNTEDAKIHSVAGFVFLQTPAIFFLFLREHPDLDVDHHTLLSAFESLNVHRVEKKGGRRKRHYGCKIYPIPIAEITEETRKYNKFIRASGYLVKANLIFGTSVPSDSTFVDFTSG
ncbi:TraI domain-containing protein [Xenorhabdus khoisanae]|uniref:TraI domain-containing protein n=1 Tax=Xenorhabdus khoisanae TaxID=880157 RepID=UPI002358B369|nr:TraI domain-containing protein [Xenorhabdus khoisanae]MDC9612883.1 TraI domain-containing protein [Xenorhabdus khoisanae]